VSILRYRHSKTHLPLSITDCLHGNWQAGVLIFREVGDAARRCHHIRTVPQLANKPPALCGHPIVHHRVHNSLPLVVPSQMKPLQAVPRRFSSQVPKQQRPSSRSPGDTHRSCSSLLNKWVAVHGCVYCAEFFWEPTNWNHSRKLTRGKMRIYSVRLYPSNREALVRNTGMLVPVSPIRATFLNQIISRKFINIIIFDNRYKFGSNSSCYFLFVCRNIHLRNLISVCPRGNRLHV